MVKYLSIITSRKPFGLDSFVRGKDKKETNDLIFSVSDTGCGIPAEDIPNMFQRFSQGTSKKRSVGTGLGLYLSRQIIESHGGKIWLESDKGKGSEFFFLLIDAAVKQEEEVSCPQ